MPLPGPDPLHWLYWLRGNSSDEESNGSGRHLLPKAAAHWLLTHPDDQAVKEPQNYNSFLCRAGTASPEKSCVKDYGGDGIVFWTAGTDAKFMNEPTSRNDEPAPNSEFKLYNMTGIAKVLHVSARYIRVLRKAGAPFPLGKSRPEWILEWLRDNSGHEDLGGNLGL